MNLETKITIYKFTPQVFTLTPFILIQRGRKKQLPPAKKESADCIILLNLLINGKRSDTTSCTAPPCQYMKKQIPTIAHNGPYSQSCF